MATREETLARLRALLPELTRRYRVRSVGLFGSVSRAADTLASDVDVLVDFTDDADLFDLVGLALFLEERLGRRVDVIPRRALRPELRESVLADLAAV